ncbi:TetR/AcrR family transcriptional regulator [[Clostridium] colinum]|uniref:TetR/AcrR family transcriptional regulator n=1 Tax=[Clostridium] colinum TaxID=36835 RepID=UPI002023FA8D|nr:TetR/AcrR family transcriptional regulator [[Clostridium] colinum]
MELRQLIVETSKKLALENGVPSMNIRLIAKECNIAVGSIYNYFSSKSELLMCTMESIWKELFNVNSNNLHFDNFTDCVKWLFKTIDACSKKYPDFFALHYVNFNVNEKTKGRKMREYFLNNFKNILINSLKNDKNIRSDAFDENLTHKIFVEYVFNLIILSFLQNQNDYKPLLKFIENSIY